MKLHKKSIIVTGASSGMGLNMTKYLLDHGSIVIALYRNKKKLNKNLGELLSHNNLHPFQVDLTQEDVCKNTIQLIFKKFKKIDGLVNFAGAWVNGNILEIKSSDLDFAINQNLRTAFIINKYVIREMIKSKTKGSIINISSVLALTGMTNSIAYSSAKAAVIQMTKNLAVDYGKYQIRVNCICPGLIDTPMTKNVFEDKNWVKKITKYYPLGRLGKVTDISPLAAFLLSDFSDWITGVSIPVDGGFSIFANIPKP